MKVSLMIPFLPLDTCRVEPYAELVASAAAHGLWQGQSVSIDGPTTFAALAGRGYHFPVGIGVSLMPLHHPYLAAVQARGLAATTGQPVVAGFGPGARSFQAGVLGRPYKSQLKAIREYVAIVRSLLDTGMAKNAGDYFSCAAALSPMDTPPIEIGLGVLRPAMATLAGEIADAAITWITPATYLEQVVQPKLAAGARRPRLVVMIPAAIERERRSARDLVLAGNAGHLRLPHYQAMLTEAGADIHPTDIAHNAAELLKVGGFLYGTEEQLIGRIKHFDRAGVDELVINCSAVTNIYGLGAGVREAQQLLDIARVAVSQSNTTTKAMVSR